MFPYRIILLVCFVTLSSFKCLGQGRDDFFELERGDQIEQLLLFSHTELDFNGSILVADKGEIIYENTIGYSDMVSRDPLDGNTPFYIASLAKQFTALSIMLLKNEAKINYNDRLNRFFPVVPHHMRQITIKHLLTHTSGLEDYFSVFDTYDNITNRKVLKEAWKQPSLEFTPGHSYRYSNTGYVVLAKIIEVASGQTYDDFLQERIFMPLEMNNTFVVTESMELPSERAIGFKRNSEKSDDYKLRTLGDGGIYSTARDMFRWERALSEYTILGKSSMDDAYAVTSLKNGNVINYGFGWNIGSDLSGAIYYHTGGLAGFRNYFGRQPSNGEAIIILSNNSNPYINEIRNVLVKIIDKRPYELPGGK